MTGSNNIGYRHIDSITVDVEPPYLARESIRPKANAQWVLTDLINLAKFLEPHVSGDGNKYKMPVLKALTEHLNDRIVVGGLKKVNGVKQKLADVRYLLPSLPR
jgi:hypothetical protein